jgi:hypothetical protein
MNDRSEHSSGHLGAKLCYFALMSFVQLSLHANFTQPFRVHFFLTDTKININLFLELVIKMFFFVIDENYLASFSNLV